MRLTAYVIALAIISVKAYMMQMRDLVDLFSALADPTRLRLLAMIAGGEACVCHFQEVIRANQPKISRHLAYLRRSGLVTARRDGKWMRYRLADLDGPRGEFLRHAIKLLAATPAIQKDLRKLNSVSC
jgi:ArsR family transcriptional regulator